MPPAPLVFSERSSRLTEQPISYFMQQAIENPHLISLAAGLVDAESLPGAEVASAMADLLGNPATARAALQYGTTPGYAPLREKLLARVTAADGVVPPEIGLNVDNVVVTTGSQQLLYLISELLLNPGDIVIRETPSYFVYQGILNSHGVRTLTVPMDEQGMITDALEERLAQLERSGELERVRLIYTCDYFQNPSGLTLSLPRRHHLLELARRYSRKHRILILEDAAYRELRYEGTDYPSIQSFDTENAYVILGLTFSKPCAPGLKTGYGFLPRDLVAGFVKLKGNHDFGSCNLTQHVLNRLIETGAYDRHVATLCEIYHRKRDAVLNALQREFAGFSGVKWTQPQGGLYVWLSFPAGVETGPQSPLMQACLKEGVLYVPGQFCCSESEDPAPRFTCEARLSFGLVNFEKIDEGIRRLARAARPLLEKQSSRSPVLTHGS